MFTARASKSYKLKAKKAFTLIEILVVIAIIGILAALALTNYNAARRNARDGRRLGDIRNIMGALEQYYNDNDSYPDDGVAGGGTNSLAGGTSWLPGMAPTYFDRVPSDPKNTAASCQHYQYELLSDGRYTLKYILERRDDSKALGTYQTATGCFPTYIVIR